MASTGSSHATAAARGILAAGGNAVDAAAAAHFALMVVDPANASLGGRVQILLRLKDGTVAAIDGATQAPRGIPSLAASEKPREGYAVVPVPGNLAALNEMTGRYGRLPLATIMQPAIALAQEGFEVLPRQAATWARLSDRLLPNSASRACFLKPDGSIPAAGERFSQPQLARVLSEIAEHGAARFYTGRIADLIAEDMKRSGGFIDKRDLASYRPLPGTVVRTSYRGYEVISAGGRAWGDTLVEMLNILERFSPPSESPTVAELEVLARIMDQALQDRPQEIGTLRPKADGTPLATLSSREFALRRAREITRLLGTATGNPPQNPRRPHDTTHLSVIDGEGNAVALTTSIGPSFGARVATPELGFLYAHSYRMRADPAAQARDETEMTPTLLLRAGRPVLAIGAAGSERIPTAILQVVSNIVDRGYSLARAVAAPRIFCYQERVRLQPGFAPEISAALAARGFRLLEESNDPPAHLGLVHAVSYDPTTGDYFGAADLLYDGTADGPGASPIAP